MMEAMREAWTDARMDDLNGKVDELGRRMDKGFNRVDADMRETRAELAAVRGEMNARFEAMHRLMIQTSAVMGAALIGLIATQL